MSDPDVGRGGRGRAGSRLRLRAGRISPGPVQPPTPTKEMGQMKLKEKSPSPAPSETDQPALAPRRGGSKERSAEPGSRGVARGPHHEAGSRTITVTKPTNLPTKQGRQGQPIDLLANFFVLWKATAWSLRLHRVDFEPQVDKEAIRNALIRQHADKLGGYSYDKGSLIYTSHDLPSNPMILTSQDQKDASKTYTITIRFVSAVEPGDNMNVQFYNVTLRRCLFNMGLLDMGRSFFDYTEEKLLSQHRLKLWPGFTTSIRNHENNVLLCVETTHKVLRTDSVLQNMEEIEGKLRHGQDYKQACADEIVGSIVMTSYNKRTYSVSDIAWNLTPASTFELKNGQKISYVDYFKEKYNLKVTNFKQPLLLTVPKKKDFHRGVNREGPQMVYLIPELCQMTGLTEAMRANFSLMKDMSKYLHEGPAGRIRSLKKFIKRLRENPENKEYLQKWGLEFQDNLLSCNGRVMDPEFIIFAGDKPEPIDRAKADWTMAFRKRQMLTTVNLEKWVMIVPQKDMNNVDNLVQTMIKVAKPLGLTMSKPNIVSLPDTKVNTYMKSIQEQSKKKDLQLMFVVLFNNNVGTYGAIKKKLSAEIGLPSQCFLAKNLTNKGLMSICTKVVIQINAKLGGEPWTVKMPLKKMMTVGFDVYHGGKLTGGKNVGALVASVTPSHASFYSTVSFFASTDEMSRNLCSDLIKSIEAYGEINNGELPERILFYRDGVGEGQLELVINSELSQVRNALETVYGNHQQPPPKLTFIIVSKKINTRLFKIGQGQGEAENPPPGTVCDNEVTLPERYDFFLIPQTARQGAVSPTSFNVIFDAQNLEPDKIQRLTYKMCHLYFNWSGTVAVPAPCQYAHKLANQTGIAIGDHSSQQLNYLLHFL